MNFKKIISICFLCASTLMPTACSSEIENANIQDNTNALKIMNT